MVPTLDLRDFERDSDDFVRRLNDAFRTWGFCGISHHGVDAALISSALEVFQRFFALPDEIKERYHLPGGAGARGYTRFGVEVARDSEFPDLKEFWQIGRELPPGHRYEPFMPRNLWPTEVDGFRDAGYGLYLALDALAGKLLRAMALCLGQPEDFFDAKVNLGNCVLRPVHYPPLSDRVTSSIRAGQHEDVNLITLLVGSRQPGLEVLSRTGEWVAVTTHPGAILCNIGDVMQRLSNHIFPSTTHRVVNPSGTMGQQPRFSTPFFVHPNPDFTIETLPSCVSLSNPNRYPEPVSSHDFLQQRLKEIGLAPGRRN